MTFGKQIETGFRTYFSALEFIFSKGLWWAFIFPVLINVGLFFGGSALIESASQNVQEWLLAKLGLGAGSFYLSEYVGWALKFLVSALFKLLFYFVFVYYGGYITLALLSPVFAYLSQKTEEIITGKKYRFDGDQWMRDMWRGLLIVFRNIFIQTGWFILMFIASFIPVIGWLSAIVLFFVSAYFYGFSSLDYTSERRKLKIRESVKFVREHKWMAIANGTVFCFFLLIPCGTFLCGFAAIISVVAATLAVNEIAPAQK